MIISYYGAECFKISQGDITLALNPVSKDSKLKTTRFGADITIITTNHPDFNGREQTSRGDKESFVIDGPGEYETKNVFIKGFLSLGLESAKKDTEKLNTIYLISFEGLKLCFLGTLTDPVLSDDILEAIEDIDILFMPVGKDSSLAGGGTLDPASAYKLAVSLEPRVIIPMNYTKISLNQFIKESGEAKVESLDKFVVKKKDLDNKEAEILVLKEE